MYRPVIDSNTASTIDADGLNRSIRAIGGFMGKGQLTQAPDGTWQTSGGQFWDNVNGRQAQRLNTSNALLRQQGGIQSDIVSADRLRAAADAMTIAQNQAAWQEGNLSSVNPFLHGQAANALSAIQQQQARDKIVAEQIASGLLKRAKDAELQQQVTGADIKAQELTGLKTANQLGTFRAGNEIQNYPITFAYELNKRQQEGQYTAAQIKHLKAQAELDKHRARQEAARRISSLGGGHVDFNGELLRLTEPVMQSLGGGIQYQVGERSLDVPQRFDPSTGRFMNYDSGKKWTKEQILEMIKK